MNNAGSYKCQCINGYAGDGFDCIGRAYRCVIVISRYTLYGLKSGGIEPIRAKERVMKAFQKSRRYGNNKSHLLLCF